MRFVLGGGFGGVTTARHLERASCADTTRRDHACEPREFLRHHAASVRSLLRKVGTAALRPANPCRSPTGTLCRGHRRSVDVERQIVRAVAAEGATYDLPYDHLVVALGASTNEQLIPGSSNAFTFKTMADALVLRNHVRTIRASGRGLGQRCVAAAYGRRDRRRPGRQDCWVSSRHSRTDVLRFYPRLARRDPLPAVRGGPRILPRDRREAGGDGGARAPANAGSTNPGVRPAVRSIPGRARAGSRTTPSTPAPSS